MDEIEIIIQEVIENVTIIVSEPGGITDHGLLTGRGDDDHAQYHTDARGDARYSPLGHDHDGTYTPVEHNHDLEYSVLGHTHSIFYEEVVFGDETDNVTINSLGIRLNGTATVFDDVRFDALSLRQTGQGVSVNTTELTVDYLSSANNLDYMIAAPQMPHARKNGAVIKPHIHWEQNQNAVPNFALQYRYQLALSGKTTAWTAVKCNIPVEAYTSGTMNMICRAETSITPPAGDDVSDIIQFRIIRDTTNALGLGFGADPYTGTVQVNSFDCHIELDSFGSFDEYVK